MTYKNYAMKMFCFSAITLTGVLAACTSERHPASSTPETVRDVPVMVVQKTVAPDWAEAVGTTRAVQTSQISSQMTGTIVEVRVQEGDRVQAGEVLAIVDDAQSRAATEQATAEVAAAEKELAAADSDVALAGTTLKRFQQLYEKKSVSPQEFDEIKARYQSAEAHRDKARAGQAQANAALDEARISLGYTRIRAPFGGVVTEKKADGGMLASPNLPLFTIEDTRRYRLEVTVDESELRFARIGNQTQVVVEALGNVPLSGKVVQIVPAADPASRSFLVKIELPADSRLRSGLFGRARFPRGERSVLFIPRTALVERGQLQGVYVLDTNQMAGLRYVTLGNSVGGQVEVLTGLQGMETLVSAPGDRELSGKRIAARQ